MKVSLIIETVESKRGSKLVSAKLKENETRRRGAVRETHSRRQRERRRLSIVDVLSQSSFDRRHWLRRYPQGGF